MTPPTNADQEADEDPGLFKLEMGEFGSGSVSDPLRHAVGLRTAQDKCKMRMWDSFSSVFQNSIFHGEKEAEIKRLRRSGTLKERLDHARNLKEMGNASFKSACTDMTAAQIEKEEIPLQQQAIFERIEKLEETIMEKERELKILRKDLADTKRELVAKENSHFDVEVTTAVPRKDYTDTLEKAITNYEMAAGVFRYVECIRPDWKNDDGSYKGIDDQHLRVDTTALDGSGPEVDEAKEFVISCYLNVALACQKLGDWDRMHKACDEVLVHVNPDSVKGLYRRAQARMGLPSCLDADRDLAIQDLHRAALLAPQDKDVRGLLQKLKSEKKRQHVNERSAFAGLFDRGEIMKDDPRKETVPRPPINWDLNDPNVQKFLDIHPGPGGVLST